MNQSLPVYHWILTFQYAAGVVETLDGIHTPDSPTETRAEIFDAILTAVRNRHGGTAVAVLYFGLALNDVAPGGAR